MAPRPRPRGGETGRGRGGGGRGDELGNGKIEPDRKPRPSRRPTSPSEGTLRPVAIPGGTDAHTTWGDAGLRTPDVENQGPPEPCPQEGPVQVLDPAIEKPAVPGETGWERLYCRKEETAGVGGTPGHSQAAGGGAGCKRAGGSTLGPEKDGASVTEAYDGGATGRRKTPNMPAPRDTNTVRRR